MESDKNLEQVPPSNELSTSSTSSSNIPSIGNSLRATLSSDNEQTQLVLNGVRDILSATILSCGLVYGIVMFISQCFEHPVAAAQLIPILLPAGAAAAAVIFKNRNKKVDKS